MRPVKNDKGHAGRVWERLEDQGHQRQARYKTRLLWRALPYQPSTSLNQSACHSGAPIRCGGHRTEALERLTKRACIVSNRRLTLSVDRPLLATNYRQRQAYVV